MTLTDKPIEPRISPLVEAMNRGGMKTHASCQGHALPLCQIKPYIAFRCDGELAANLEKVLRADAESVWPKLKWGWCVDASFDHSFGLVYRLTMTKPHYFIYWFMRSSVDHDLSQLHQVVNELTEHF